MNEETHRCPNCSEYLDIELDEDMLIESYYYWCPNCGWEEGDDEP